MMSGLHAIVAAKGSTCQRKLLLLGASERSCRPIEAPLRLLRPWSLLSTPGLYLPVITSSWGATSAFSSGLLALPSPSAQVSGVGSSVVTVNSCVISPVIRCLGLLGSRGVIGRCARSLVVPVLAPPFTVTV